MSKKYITIKIELSEFFLNNGFEINTTVTDKLHDIMKYDDYLKIIAELQKIRLKKSKKYHKQRDKQIKKEVIQEFKRGRKN